MDELTEAWMAYEAKFGGAPPMMQLPSDEAAAAALLRRAVAENDPAVLDGELPDDAAA